MRETVTVLITTVSFGTAGEFNMHFYRNWYQFKKIFKATRSPFPSWFSLTKTISRVFINGAISCAIVNRIIIQNHSKHLIVMYGKVIKDLSGFE